MSKKTVTQMILVRPETIVGIVLALLLLAVIQPTICDSIVINQTKEEQGSSPQVFRILAVEDYPGGYPFKSGQFLINTLLDFSNWGDSSTDYVSYIHLLSEYEQDEVMDECKPYWTGYSTKANVEYEIKNFLASADPSETVFLYFCVEGSIATALLLAYPLEIIYPAELTSWLSSGGLPQANVCVILDSCYSGSWIDDGEEPGGYLGPGRIVLCSSLSNQGSYGHPVELWSYFTGYGFPYNTGIIAALLGGADDTNQNGWIDVMECFEFAKTSTEEYTDQKMNPVAYNGIGQDIPFVRLPEATHDVAITNVEPTRTIISNATHTTVNVTAENQGEVEERFNVTLFYDSNIIGTQTITLPALNSTVLTFNWTTPVQLGNYTLTAEASQVPGEIDTEDNVLSFYPIQVSIPGDIDVDYVVNILDIATVAQAYGTRPGDEDWNPNADVNEDRIINILDLATIAKEYGKSI